MLFAEDTAVVVDPMLPWIGALTAIAVTVGFLAQIYLQIQTKHEATRVAAEAKAAALERAALAKADTEQVAKTANLAAQEAKAVKEALVLATSGTQEKLDKIDKMTNVVHDLVNSASIIQLKLYVNATKRLAAGGNPDDVKEAEMAARELQLRQEAQDKAVVATANKS